jgi:hypothetical protein
MARITWLPAVFALGLAFTNVQGPDPSLAPSKITSLMRSKLDVAQKGFKLAWDDQESDVEVAYRWSCRWLEAERELSDKTEDRIAALQAHLARVRDIEQVTKRQFLRRLTTSITSGPASIMLRRPSSRCVKR